MKINNKQFRKMNKTRFLCPLQFIASPELVKKYIFIHSGLPIYLCLPSLAVEKHKLYLS